MRITSSLFGHIQNDAFLNGTSNLEGNNFLVTIAYLRYYVAHLQTHAPDSRDKYEALLLNLNDLIEVESTIQPSKVNALASNIAEKILALSSNKSIFLPGGWQTATVGHAMVYEFKRLNNDAYYFTVFNSGKGLQYHEKKSTLDKELYNPTKVWRLEHAVLLRQSEELKHFLARLLIAKIPSHPDYGSCAMTAEKLYTEILPSIIYLDAVEQDTNRLIPEFGYTGGQLSGTCAQRCLHQMLKIISPSLSAYQQFIFGFKRFALLDYLYLCEQGKQQISFSVIDQIVWAIDNNIKILNNPHIFNFKDKIYYENDFLSIIGRVKKLQKKIQGKSKKDTIKNLYPAFLIVWQPIFQLSPSVDIYKAFLSISSEILKKLPDYVLKIPLSNSYDIKINELYDLEQTVLNLPSDLGQIEGIRLIQFKKQLSQLIATVSHFKKVGPPTAVLHIMALHLMALLADTHEKINDTENKPSFKIFTDSLLATFIKNQIRNPLYATNHPGFDSIFKSLQQRFLNTKLITYHNDYYTYLNDVMITADKEIFNELGKIYDYDFCKNNEEFHYFIKKNNLKYLYTQKLLDDFISLKLFICIIYFFILSELKKVFLINYTIIIFAEISIIIFLWISKYEKTIYFSKYARIWKALNDHLNYEKDLIIATNIFLDPDNKASEDSALNFNREDGVGFHSSLFVTGRPCQPQNNLLGDHKYALHTSSTAWIAFGEDVSNKPPGRGAINVRSANHIQLYPEQLGGLDAAARQITPQDLVIRDYCALRSVPAFQIDLTLDYFSRNLSSLCDESAQRYFEANLFQPGLLLDALQNPNFESRWNKFLQEGMRHYMPQGQHSIESLFFVRQDYLLSRYWALSKLDSAALALTRLSSNEKKITSELDHTQNLNPELRYALNQYLFLTIVTQIELYKPELSHPSFLAAVKAYFYIKTATNPHILEDNVHCVQVNIAIQAYQRFLKGQEYNVIQDALNSIFSVSDLVMLSPYNFEWTTQTGERVKADVLTGRIFDKASGLAQSSTPLELKHHPLLCELAFNQVQNCLINDDETYCIIVNPDNDETIYLRHQNSLLTVQKYFSKALNTKRYQLLPLTAEHLAHHANPSLAVPMSTLPKILTDGSMNYWAEIGFHGYLSGNGVFTQYNQLVYEKFGTTFYCLNPNGTRNGNYLVQIPSTPINAFEDNQFILAHQQQDNRFIEIVLPRFNLSFLYNIQTKELIAHGNGERVIDYPSPIHYSVASIVLEKDGHKRVLIPISRFYADKPSTDPSEFYPFHHDMSGKIADDYWTAEYSARPVKIKSLWHYQKSERFVSFKLDESGQPKIETVAEGLYLAYIYLATNQTLMAWSIIEDCKIRLGGLQGQDDELQFIRWIVQAMPHCFSGDAEKKSQRKTPPYVSCQLKVFSLLCHYLLQGKHFANLPVKTIKSSLNESYGFKIIDINKRFIEKIGINIFKYYTRYQKISRHLDHSYQLNFDEEKGLLDYYKYLNPQNLFGALGAAHLKFSLETLENERQMLGTQENQGNRLSIAQRQRGDGIERRLQDLSPILGCSTAVKEIEITISVKSKPGLKACERVPEIITLINRWYDDLFATKYDSSAFEKAIKMLSSCIKNRDFVIHFPIYLKIACTTDSYFTKILENFCRQTLIARFYEENDSKQSVSIVSLLSRVLYVVINNADQFRQNIADTSQLSWENLINFIQNYPKLTIAIYQAQDVYCDLLCDRQLMTTGRDKRLINVRMEINNTNEKLFTFAFSEDLYSLIGRYKGAQQNFANQIAHLTEASDRAVNHNIFSLEQTAGELIAANKLSKKELAIELMGSEIKNYLIKTIQEEQTLLEKHIEKLWQEALDLANRGPNDKMLNQSWRLQRESKARPYLNQSHLLSLYSRADLAHSMQTTGLDEESSKLLFSLSHKALVSGIRHKVCNKILALIQDVADEDDFLEALHYLAYDKIPGQIVPAIMIMQHESDILLRSSQVKALSRLLEKGEDKPFKEFTEKITMGGGKSKILLPLLAECKAMGNNLVVIEVPESLLATNYVDLNTLSSRLFGKTAYLLQHNRESMLSAQGLQIMYQELTKVMGTRSYVVTTGVSIQSLQLKYLELLLQKDSEEAMLAEKKIYWLGQIMNLFRNYADCLIDEAHQGLAIHKKLNYVSGVTKPISATLIKLANGLFNLIADTWICNAPSFPVNYDWTEFKQSLAKNLVSHKGSPLAFFAEKCCKKHGNQASQWIIDYLTNQADNIPLFIQNAGHQDKEALAFCKYQITQLLPRTLTRVLDVHYGASKNAGMSATQRTLAIPYSASNTPNERSRFVNAEAINYSIQMMRIKGIDKELMIQRIKHYHTLALTELREGNGLSFDQTKAASIFYQFTNDDAFTLQKLDLSNNEQIDRLHSILRFNESLRNEILEDLVLKLIQHDSIILHGDAFGHVDCYRTVQCLSGTPSNFSTYHHRLHYDVNSSSGSDGYILQILKDKKTQISALDYQDLSQFLQQLFIREFPQNTYPHAIIDINASFKSVTNFEVATAIAHCLRADQRFSAIKYVLYFDEAQILCALVVDKPEKNMILGSSDEKELKRLLNASPQERFTYYDQAHTFGIDIKQDPHSHAWVFLDEKIDLDAVLQGCMRMRGLGGNQSIECIVPTRIGNITLKNLFYQLYDNQQRKLMDSNFIAAKEGMLNVVRNNLVVSIQNIQISDTNTKKEMAQKFRMFLVSETQLAFFSLYGQINKKQSVKNILDQYANQLIQSWIKAKQCSGLDIDETELQWLKNNFDSIILRASKNCATEVKASVAGDAVEAEVDIQQQVHKHVEQQIETIHAYYSPDRQESAIHSWNDYQIGSSITWVAIPLNEIIKNTKYFSSANRLNRPTEELFTPTLSASKNYLNVYTTQKTEEVLGLFLKPVFLILYYFDSAEKISAMIITPQDANALSAKIMNAQSAWLSTTEDSLILGKKPDGVLTRKDYQVLREQVRFFNGEFSSFLKEAESLVWLLINPEKKLKFFEQNLMPFRQNCGVDYERISAILLQINFQHILQKPFEDYTEINWQELDSEITDIAVPYYRRLASIFHDLNTQWQEGLQLPSIINLIEQYKIHPLLIDYVKTHCKNLIDVKLIIEQLVCGKSPGDMSAPILNPRGQAVLEWFLNVDLGALSRELSVDSEYIALMLMIYEKKSLISESLNKGIITYLRNFARTTHSTDCLRRLLNNKTLALENEVFSRINAGASSFSSHVWQILAEYCSKDEWAWKILGHCKKNEPVLRLLIKNPCLSENLLIGIIQASNSSETVDLMVAVHCPGKRIIIPALLGHTSLSTDNIIKILQGLNYLCSYDEWQLILRQRALTEEILCIAIQHAKSGRVLHDIICHTHASRAVFQRAIDNQYLSVKSAMYLIAKHLQDINLDQALRWVNTIYQQLHQSNDPEWLSCLRQLFQAIPALRANENLLEIILFAASKSRSEEFTEYLLQMANTTQAIAILQRLYQYNAQFIVQLLQHPHVTKTLLAELARSATESFVLEQIAHHQDTDSAIRQILLQNHALPMQPELAARLVEQDTGTMDKDNLLLLAQKIHRMSLVSNKQQETFELLSKLFQKANILQSTPEMIGVIEYCLKHSNTHVAQFNEYLNRIFGDISLEFLFDQFATNRSDNKEQITILILHPESSLQRVLHLFQDTWCIELIEKLLQYKLADLNDTDLGLLVQILVENHSHCASGNDQNWYLCLEQALSNMQIVNCIHWISMLKNYRTIARSLAPLFDACLLNIANQTNAIDALMAIFPIESQDIVFKIAERSLTDPKIITTPSQRLELLTHVIRNTSSNNLFTYLLDGVEYFPSITDILVARIEELYQKNMQWLYYKKLMVNLFDQYHRSHDAGNRILWINILHNLWPKMETHPDFSNFLIALKKRNNSPFPVLDSYIFRSIAHRETLLPQLSLESLIQEANPEELSLLTKLPIIGSHTTHFLHLSKRVTSKQDILSLLSRTELTQEVATVLFAKEAYDGFISRSWPDFWLNEKQIIFTLNNSRDDLSFQCALQHKNLSDKECRSWLSTLRQNQRHAEQLARVTDTPQQKIELALARFKLKSRELAVSALTNPHYKEAARMSFKLHLELDAELRQYFSNPSPENLLILQTNCSQAIQVAMPILATHRGLKQALCDVLNLIMAALTFRLFSNDWRFFKVKTNSMQVLDQFQKPLIALVS